MPQFGCTTSIRAASLLLLLVGAAWNSFSQTNADPPRPACSCSDGRQFSTGSSLFGKNSARVVITGFRRDLVESAQGGGLPACKDLMVVGQTIRLEVLGNHPFLRRENRKTGIIADICHTKVLFVEPKKSYDFFKDDGTAVTLSDMDSGQLPADRGPGENIGAPEDAADRRKDDLTGKDLIHMIPSEQETEDPGSSSFDVDDLKEGAYFIVRRQVKASPAVDDALGTNVGVPPNTQREVTIWAGSLGRIEKRAGFRDGPLWLVEVLPHSAPVPFTSYLRSLPSAFAKHRPLSKKFVLASDDIVEINHFFDKYSLEWTRFGEDSDDARERESAGTTGLPDVYGPAQPDLNDNLENARKAGIEKDILAAATRLVFRLKDTQPVGAAGRVLVLEDETAPGFATPHYFHKQCFVGEYPAAKTAGSSRFRVTEASLAIFQPERSPQVPDNYYAVDVRFQLKSDGGRSMPVVCRFPSAAIEANLLDSAQGILSSVFLISPAAR